MAMMRLYTKSVEKKRAFALLIAVIFMSVMLAFGLSLGALAYKQQTLASTATQSQFAFYAADTALECALVADQQNGIFSYPTDPLQTASLPALMCDGNAPESVRNGSNTTGPWVTITRMGLDGNTRCADVTVYKPATNAATTSIFAQGYNEPCDRVPPTATADNHLVARGLEAYYR